MDTEVVINYDDVEANENVKCKQAYIGLHNNLKHL